MLYREWNRSSKTRLTRGVTELLTKAVTSPTTRDIECRILVNLRSATTASADLQTFQGGVSKGESAGRDTRVVRMRANAYFPAADPQGLEECRPFFFADYLYGVHLSDQQDETI